MRSTLNILLVSICILIGVGSRIVAVDSFPPSLNWDEISLGYNAYSLLHTGTDEWGVSFPTIFRAYGDYKLPVYIYALVPNIWIFGLTSVSVRAVSVIAGLLTVAVLGILVKKLFPKHASQPIFVTLIGLVVPWTWFLSRVGLEANLGLLFVVTGITCFIYNKTIVGSLMLGLSLWTYNANRIFTPLFFITYVLINKKILNKNKKSMIVFAIFTLATILQLLMPSGQARYRWTTLLDEGAIAHINESRSDFGGRLLNNKITYIIKNISINYVKHFSPTYLFFTGGTQYQFNLQNTGLISMTYIPFFILGIIRLMSSKSQYKKLVFCWLVLAPIPGSITRDAPHVLRSLSMMPPLLIIISLGMSIIVEKYKFIFPLIVSLILFSFIWYLAGVKQYAYDYAWAWQFGYKEMVSVVKEKYDSVDEIIISKKYGEPHEFLLFYWPWDSHKYQTDKKLNRYAKSDWFWVDGFDKFRFINDWEMANVVANLSPGKRYLIISSPTSKTIGSTYSQISFPDGKTAFTISIL